MTKEQALLVTALAENSLRMAQVARKMNYCRSSIYYHVKKLKMETGKDPRDYHDMLELEKEAMKVLAEEEKGESDADRE